MTKAGVAQVDKKQFYNLLYQRRILSSLTLLEFQVIISIYVLFPTRNIKQMLTSHISHILQMQKKNYPCFPKQ